MKGNYKVASEWCSGCDRIYLEIGKKCPHCGKRNKKKFKKPNKAQILKEQED